MEGIKKDHGPDLDTRKIASPGRPSDPTKLQWFAET